MISKNWIDNNKPILDIRHPDEYALQHIYQSTNIYLKQLDQRLHELPTKEIPLWLIGNETLLEPAQQFLLSKGYILAGSNLINNIKTELLQSGQQSKQLWQPNFFLKEALNLLPNLTNKTVIDIGCGSGRDSVYMAMQKLKVLSIDVKKQALEKAQLLANTHNVTIKTLQSNIEKAPFNPAPVNIVTVMRYLHRPLLQRIPNFILSNGYIIYQTFMDGCQKFGSPKRQKYLLAHNELANTFLNFKILINRIDYLQDGRPVNSFLAKKLDKNLP